MASPVKIAHIVLRTHQYDEMVEWYQFVFEGTIQHQNPNICFMTFDDEHHRFAFINLGKSNALTSSTPPSSGVDHVAFTFDDLDALMATYKRLKERGIEPYWPIHHGMTISLYYTDPDSNRLEFQVDKFETMQEGTNFFHSKQFEKNPIGVNIDVEDLLNRYESGESHQSLFEFPNSPPAKIPPEHGI